MKKLLIIALTVQACMSTVLWGMELQRKTNNNFSFSESNLFLPTGSFEYDEKENKLYAEVYEASDVNKKGKLLVLKVYKANGIINRLKVIFQGNKHSVVSSDSSLLNNQQSLQMIHDAISNEAVTCDQATMSEKKLQDENRELEGEIYGHKQVINSRKLTDKNNQSLAEKKTNSSSGNNGNEKKELATETVVEQVDEESEPIGSLSYGDIIPLASLDEGTTKTIVVQSLIKKDGKTYAAGMISHTKNGVLQKSYEGSVEISEGYCNKHTKFFKNLEHKFANKFNLTVNEESTAPQKSEDKTLTVPVQMANGTNGFLMSCKILENGNDFVCQGNLVGVENGLKDLAQAQQVILSADYVHAHNQILKDFLPQSKSSGKDPILNKKMGSPFDIRAVRNAGYCLLTGLIIFALYRLTKR